MIRRLRLAAATAVLSLIAIQAFAADRLETVLEQKVLRVGMTGDFKPFTYLNPETKQFEGMDVDLAQSLGKALGVEVKFVHTSWPTLMADLTADKFDIGMSGISVNLERQKKALFSTAFMVSGKTPITKCENVSKFQTLEQIDKPGVRLVVNPGGTNERFARANIKQAEITVYNDNVTIFDQIVAGKADLMITDAIETMLQQKLRPALCAVHPEEPFNYAEIAYLLPPDMRWKAYVDQWLHLAIKSKEYEAVYNKWLK